MRVLSILLAFSMAVSVGCKGEAEEESDECYSNDDAQRGKSA